MLPYLHIVATTVLSPHFKRKFPPNATVVIVVQYNGIYFYTPFNGVSALIRVEIYYVGRYCCFKLSHKLTILCFHSLARTHTNRQTLEAYELSCDLTTAVNLRPWNVLQHGVTRLHCSVPMWNKTVTVLDHEKQSRPPSRSRNSHSPRPPEAVTIPDHQSSHSTRSHCPIQLRSLTMESLTFHLIVHESKMDSENDSCICEDICQLHRLTPMWVVLVHGIALVTDTEMSNSHWK